MAASRAWSGAERAHGERLVALGARAQHVMDALAHLAGASSTEMRTRWTRAPTWSASSRHPLGRRRLDSRAAAGQVPVEQRVAEVEPASTSSG
jgi:hypothetical protein